jgi:hypothetical protein
MEPKIRLYFLFIWSHRASRRWVKDGLEVVLDAALIVLVGERFELAANHRVVIKHLDAVPLEDLGFFKRLGKLETLNQGAKIVCIGNRQNLEYNQIC